MKKIIILFTVILGLTFTFVSCEKKATEPTYNATATVIPAITSPAGDSEMTLLLADSANPVVFDWSKAEYKISEGVLSNPVYSLFIVQADSSWDNAKELINTTDLNYEIIVYELNNTLYALGLTPEVPTTLKMRVSSIIGTVSVTSAMSDEISLTATIFEPPTPPVPGSPSMWVPGAYQGWSPATAPQIWDIDEDGVFEGYVYFPDGASFDGNFKFTANPDWVDGGNYGTDGTEFGLDTDSGAGNLEIPGPGGYWLTCDVITLQWSYVEQSYGVIGSGILNGDWTEDVDMVAPDAGPYNVIETTIDVSASQDAGTLRFKYRLNNAWDIAYGADEGSNVLSSSGPDIQMPDGPGNYTFKMDMSKPEFTYELILNSK